MAIAMMTWLLAIPTLGGMTGLRTMTPMAVLCWFAYRGDLSLGGTWGFWAGRPVTVIVFAVLAVGELVGDKLPRTPNRTAPGPLISRVIFGGLVGALAATGLSASAIEGALLASFSALLWTFLGFYVRRYLVVDRHYSGAAVALAEDVIAIGLSVLAMGIVTA